MAKLNAYSGLDQAIHRIAFAGGGRLQRSMAEMEDSLFARDLAGIGTDRPIFITSLPRAGTTILLTALAHLPDLATHLYRDMPFLMAPQLWSRLSGGFRKGATLSERAHGDGIAVGYDSPEAFEEIIWKAFWPDHYSDGRIALWRATDRDAEGEAFLRRHFAKIIALRCGPGAAGARYISKNNGNMARIPLLRAIFPAAEIVVPVREPASHARSLLRQHLNFLGQHRRDAFVRRYMADIGHYEFGTLHRPIGFPGFAALAEGLAPESIGYWLAYWIAAFEHLRDQEAGLHFVSHEAARAEPHRVMADLCARIGLAPGDALDRVAGEFSAIRETADYAGVPKDLLGRARALHSSLRGID